MAVQRVTHDEESSADIELAEYEESTPFELSEAAERMLTQEINGGSERDGDRIKLRYNREGQAILTATQYVGVVSLRDGPTIEIQPKAAGTNLLSLLQYAHNTTATTFDTQTPYRAGETFRDALGALYAAELRRILNQGLHTEYLRKDSAEKHLRGQLQLQRQLQRQPPTPTEFECTYDELSYDTTANQAILYATTVLLGMVSDPSITQTLQQHQQLLRRQVSLRSVSPEEIDRIELTRLSEYYENILRLAQLVIRSSFIGELETGTNAAFAMLVNMNTVFEKAVERAVRNSISEFAGWTVEPQERSKSLLRGGKHEVTLKPDITVYDESGEIRLVGDAKWKTDTPSNADFFQMTSYMLARDAPGLLFYPHCDGNNATQTTVAERFSLNLTELPTAIDVESHSEFIEEFEVGVRTAMASLVH